MTLKQIEYFLKVCELKQISECSKFFGISQSAMSISIKNLENSLGGDLFDRRGKSLSINERGKAFYKSIKPIYNRVLEIERNMQNESMYELSLMSSQNVGTYLSPYILSGILEKNDKINLSVSMGNTTQILDEVVNNKIDIGLIEGDLENSDVKSVLICKDEVIVVTGNKNLSDKTYSINDLTKEEWVMRESGSGTRDSFYANLPGDISLNTILELPTTEAIKRCLEDSNYFTCLPRFAVKNELGKSLFEVKVKGKKFLRNIYLVYSKDKDDSETFLNIISKIEKEIRQTHAKLTEI